MPIPIGTPLPDVAGCVVQTIAIGRDGADRCRCAVAVFRGVLAGESSLPDVGHPFAARLEVLAPGIFLAVETAARCELKLRLRRQALAGPPGVGNGIVPGDLDNGMLLASLQTTLRTFGVLPASVFHVAPPTQM